MRIVLKQQQPQHVDKLFFYQENANRSYDCSSTGTGKSICGLELFARLQRSKGVNKLILISKKSILHQLIEEMLKYTKEIVDITRDGEVMHLSKDTENSIEIIEYFRTVTFSQLGGKKSGEKVKVANGLMYREDINGEIIYTAGKTLSNVIDEKTVIWIDEAHKLRNSKTVCYKAARVLVELVLSQGGHVMLSSATPASEKKHFLALGSLLAWFPNYLTRFCFYNMDDIIDMLSRLINPVDAERNVIACDNYETLIERVLFPAISSSITQEVEDAEEICKDLVFPADPEIIQQYNDLVEQIIYANTRGLGAVVGNLSALEGGIEELKLPSVVLLARKILRKKIKGCTKVIIACRRNNSLQDLNKALAEFKPVIYNGSVSNDDRQKIQRNFNKPSSQLRLILANVHTLNEGINLHDTHGDYPRYIIILPNVYFYSQSQASGRTFRVGSKSNSHIFPIYMRDPYDPNFVIKEQLHRGLMKKSAILERTISSATHLGDTKRQYFGGYPTFQIPYTENGIEIELEDLEK